MGKGLLFVLVAPCLLTAGWHGTHKSHGWCVCALVLGPLPAMLISPLIISPGVLGRACSEEGALRVQGAPLLWK